MTYQNNFQKLFLISVLLCNTVLSVNSQMGNIEGIVKRDDGKPLQRVKVEIVGTSNKTDTNSDGKYYFKKLPIQEYEIKFSKVFYQDKSVIIFVKDDNVTEVFIVLIPQPINAKIQRLPSYLDEGNLDEIAKEINLLNDTCNDDKSDDCKLLDEINSTIKSKNVDSLNIKITQLLYNFGVINEANYFFKIGNAQLNNKEFNEAIVNLTKLIEIEKTATFAYTGRGEAFYKIGDFNNAILDYTEAIKLNSRDPELLKSRSEVYFQSKKLLDAKNDISNAIKLDPNEPDLYLQRAKIYDALRLKDLADADRRKAEFLKQNLP